MRMLQYSAFLVFMCPGQLFRMCSRNQFLPLSRQSFRRARSSLEAPWNTGHYNPRASMLREGLMNRITNNYLAPSAALPLFDTAPSLAP